MTIDGHNIRVTSTEGEFEAYLAASATPNGVVVVVLQEIFGVNANIRGICDDLAGRGYSAVAPDLYWRIEPGVELDPGSEDGRTRAVALMKDLDRDAAVRDAEAALAAARERLPVLRRSAAIGYCFGGGVAYLLAVRGKVDAGVAYYGTYIHTLLDEAAGLEGRLLLHIAEQDHLCPPDAQAAIVGTLEAVGDKAMMLVHPGVGHAFARRGGATYDQQAAERADAATMALLASLPEAK